MTYDDIFDNAYKLRTSFIKELAPLLDKRINYDLILDLYKKYILMFPIEHESYLNIFVPNFKTVKRKKIKDKRIFLCFIYDLVVNIHNAYISSLESEIDVSKFFLGFSIYELVNIEDMTKLVKIFKDEKSYDIDLLELVSIYDEKSANIIIEHKLQDIYLLQKLSNYFDKSNLIDLLEQINFIDKKYHKCNKAIAHLIIELISII